MCSAGQHADENYRRQNEERKAQDASDALEGEYLSKLHSGDPNVSGTVTRALSDKIAEYRRTPGKNPYDLMDPSKPDFMGTPAALLQYQKPVAESIRDISANLKRTSQPGKSVNLTADSEVTGIETPRHSRRDVTGRRAP